MTTIQEVAEKFNITPEQVKELKNGMSIVWDQISYDCYEFAEFYDSESEMIAEMTLDAGRLEEYTRIRGDATDWSWLNAKELDVMALGVSTWEARYV